MSKCIVFIDDDPIFHMFLEQQLSLVSEHLHAGFIHLSNPLETSKTVAGLQKKGFDIVLFVDLNMPEMDGITTINRLKATIDDLPPTFILTSSVNEADKHTIENHPDITDILIKPLEWCDLKNALLKVDTTFVKSESPDNNRPEVTY